VTCGLGLRPQSRANLGSQFLPLSSGGADLEPDIRWLPYAGQIRDFDLPLKILQAGEAVPWSELGTERWIRAHSQVKRSVTNWFPFISVFRCQAATIELPVAFVFMVWRCPKEEE